MIEDTIEPTSESASANNVEDDVTDISIENTYIEARMDSLQRLQDSIENMPKVVIPTTALQSLIEIQKSMYFPAIERIKETLAGISKMYIDFSRSAFVTGLGNMFQNTEWQESIRRIVNSYNSTISSAIQSPAFQWFKNFDFTPFAEAIRRIAEIDFDKLKEIYLQEMYDAHWFPYASWNADLALSSEILEILDETRKSKNRIKRIDKAVFTYYTKERIEDTKKQWRTLGLPEHQMRILHQAVQAYHRKEYAITVIVLTTQWEGIIYNKAHDSGRKISKRTKQHLAELVDKNDYFDIFNSYFEDFIMYDCNSTSEVIEDVPGRHSAAHNFYEKYPTRKAALNAILFTDFLLNLEPLEEEISNG